MPPRRNTHNSHCIKEFFGNRTKKQKKEIKEMQKQFKKCPQLGQVGSQLRRVLSQYREEIMKEFAYGDLVKQISEVSKLDSIGGMLNSILYLNVTRVSDYWSDIYTPDHVDDLLSQHNTQILKHWLKSSFSILRQDQVEDSDSWDSQSNSVGNQNWNYQMLNIYGSSGKMSTIVAIARTYNIEVILTYEYTEKKEFEEMFASQHIKFKPEQQITEFGIKKKIIIHRGALPKFLNSRFLQIQRVPFIWITDSCQNHELFDGFELLQYQHDDIVKYFYLILLIEYNYRDQLDSINSEFKKKVIYENLKDRAKLVDFYNNFYLIKPTITTKELNIKFDLSEISMITLQMKGNVRSILNWLQFHHEDQSICTLIMQMKLDQTHLQYMLKNHLPIFKTEQVDNHFNVHAQKWHDQQCIELVDNIVECRKNILKRNYSKKSFKSKFNSFLINYVIKTNAINTQQRTSSTRQRRLNKEPTDIYKPLQQFFQDEQEYEWFKQFDKSSAFLVN
ncbi:unnamed protein product [Paramecium octaurelia]|uniref:Uncharacterized protein n=1 Tax=Paramecium octaurelia TaxID=43137 RepID=A0A8S1TMX0_PAROT|nr:unnamed protein product [Paramecium octaurelia]